MDAERLVDYLAGELDPDERRAIEAQLARDPALRARLQRLREADDALAQLPPATPAEGFDERLRAALAPELRRRLGDEAIVASDATTHDRGDGPDPAAAHPDLAAEDELSRHRERARRRAATWPRAVGGVAAGLALLGVAGVALLGLPGGGDEAAAPVSEGADDLAAGDGPGPVVVATDRDLGEGDVASLLDEPALAALAGRDLDAAEGTALAEDFTSVLGDDAELRSLEGTASVTGRSDATADAEAEAEAAPEADGAPGAADGSVADAESSPTAVRDLDDVERADVRRCLDALLDGAQEPIPAYVEVTRYEGAPAIAFGLLTRGTDGRGYERLEVWVLERDDCQVRTLQQRDL